VGPEGGGREEPDRELADDFTRVVGEVRQADARRSRVRERNLRAAATAEATLLGVLLDLAEQNAPVLARTTSGRTVQGRVCVVARDAIVVESSGGVLTHVQLSHVASVRPPAARAIGWGEPAGDRSAPRDTSFANLLADLAAERPRVAVTVAGEGTVMRGELRAAGADILTVLLEGDPPGVAYVATRQVSELTVLASG
jgi:hypothetical protein